MPLWSRISSLWRNLFHKERVERELDDEVLAYVNLLTEEKVQSGMSLIEARRAALIELGGVNQVKEQVREARIGTLLETLVQDLRFGFRTLVKNAGFTAVAVISLALGIGATTTVFSIYDAIFLRPLPYPEPDRMVGTHESRLDNPSPEVWGLVSTPTFMDWKNQSQSFEGMAEVTWTTAVFNGSKRAEQVQVQHISEGYFHLLGARTCQGRLFIPDDYAPGQPRRAILSYPAWQRLTGSNPSIVGSTIKVNGDPHYVIGVMSPEYRPLGEIEMDLWVQNFVAKRETRIWIVIARLKPGISIRKAQAELDVIEARLARQYPEQKGYGARVQPLQIYLYGNFKNQFLAFFGAVVLVLLIACLNVANLLLARGTAREKEMAVRSSLGAGRPRLIRQLLTESLLLSALGAALGLLFAYAAIRFAIYLSPGDAMPREDEISINWHVLGSAVLLVLLTGWLFGLFPALRASKPDLTESLKEGGHRPVAHLGGSRIQNVLVIGQIALSLLLLVGAGMLIHNVWCALYANYGFKADHLAQLSIQLIPSEYMESIGDGSVARMKPKTALTIQSIKDRLRVLPGVSSVSVSSIGVFSGCNDRPMSSAGPPRRDSVQSACYEPVSLGYFGMLEIPVLKGRVFTEGDSSGSPPVAVISQSVVERYFPGQDPIGKMINIGSSESNDFERRQVVGVVGDIQWAVNWPIHSAVYYPYSQMPVQFPSMEGEYERLRVTFLVRSEVNPATLVRVMDRVVPEVARNVAISESETVDSIRRVRSQWTRFYTWLLVAFTATALALAAVGMFGVMSYEASQRTHEMGIRMALGARSRDVLRLILRNGILMTSVGMAIGLGTSLALGRFLESRLGEFSASEVKPMDLSTLAVVSILLAVVALLACYLPARRATKVVSMAVLRHE